MFASNLSSIAALHARQGLASADFRFTVPKSPIRSDGVRIAGESQPATLASDSFITLDVRRMPAFHSYAPSPGRRLREDELPGGDPDADRTRKGVEKAPESRPSSSADSGQENVRNRDEAEDDETRRIGRETDAGGEPLDDVEQVELDKLQERDREVRRHEQAHKAAAGRYAGAIFYEYSQGPDGKRYAVGGEVGIDISPEKDPEATIAKMRQIKAAATAPAEPSPQDRAVAAEASRIEMRARQELRREADEKSESDDGKNAAASSASAGENDKTARIAGGSGTASGEKEYPTIANRGRPQNTFPPPRNTRRGSLDITI